MDLENPKEWLEDKLAEIAEHFECVQILATWEHERNTESVATGIGNWYARQGLAHEFIGLDRAQENAHALKKVLPPTPPEEGDEWRTC